MITKVFLSYSHADKDLMKKIKAELIDYSDQIKIILDSNLKDGVSLHKGISSLINQCNIIIYSYCYQKLA